MKSFETYLTEGEQLIVDSITYDEYVIGISENLNEGKFKDYFESKKKKIFSRLKFDFARMATFTKLSMADIKETFLNNVVFGLLKTFGFSFAFMIKLIVGATSLLRDGLLDIFKDLHDTEFGQMERKGGVKADDYIKKHPLLKRLTGPMIAGLLLFMWLNMTFIGNAKYDLDFSDMAAALTGKFSIEKLFGSPKGLMLITLFATGSIASFPWLILTEANLILAILYTGVTKAKSSGRIDAIKMKIRAKIKTSKKIGKK